MGDESGDSTGPSRGEPSRKIKRVNTKRKGELSEAAFLLKAAGLGFGVAKPWGDSERYDFILDSQAPISITTTPITTILIAKTLTAPILITTTLTTTIPTTAPPAVASGAFSSSAPKSYALAVTTSSPSTPSTGKAKWFTPPTTSTSLSPTSSRSISGTCSPSRPSRPAKAF